MSNASTRESGIFCSSILTQSYYHGTLFSPEFSRQKELKMKLKRQHLGRIAASLHAAGLHPDELATFCDANGMGQIQWDDIITQIRTNNGQRKGGSATSKLSPKANFTSLAQAQSIMPHGSTLCMESVSDSLGVKYSENDQKRLTIIPFTEEMLDERKATHALIVGYPMTPIELWNNPRVSNPDKPLFNPCLEREMRPSGLISPRFTNRSTEPRWFLLRKLEVPNSINGTYAAQEDLVPWDEEIPFACDVIYTAVVYYLANCGERLFENVRTRCADWASYSRHVRIGPFQDSGLNYMEIHREGINDRVGMISIKNP